MLVVRRPSLTNIDTRDSSSGLEGWKPYSRCFPLARISSVFLLASCSLRPPGIKYKYSGDAFVTHRWFARLTLLVTYPSSELQIPRGKVWGLVEVEVTVESEVTQEVEVMIDKQAREWDY